MTYIIPNIPTAVTQDEADVLYMLARNKTVLEVGSLLGFSTIVMAQSAREVHSVDPHVGYPHDDPRQRPTLVPFWNNLERYSVRDRVVLHVGTDEQVFPTMCQGFFDFAFVDLSLTDGTTDRVIAWCKYLLHGLGTLAVHDYGHKEWPGATEAVDRLGLPFRLVDTLAIIE